VTIASGKHRAYRDASCIAALEDFLDRAIRSGRQSSGAIVTPP
jgi:hypothetical protein